MASLRDISSKTQLALLFGLDAVLLIATSLQHSLWRDEAQAWLIARDSASPWDLIQSMRYEGHPPIWHLILYPITRFTHNPDWIKLPNLLFALAASALVLFRARCSVGVRAGIAFSYFFLFEYGVISRNYMLGVALLLVAISFHRDWLMLRWATTIALSLAALTSLPAMILAGCLFALRLYEAIMHLRKKKPAGLPSQGPLGLTAQTLTFALSAVASCLSIRPPADSSVFLDAASDASGGLRAKFFLTMQSFAESYLPVPAWKTHVWSFWNQRYFDLLPRHLGPVLGCAIIAALAVYFRSPAVRLFFFAGSSVLMAQILVSDRAGMRHVGWLFVCFILALLMEEAARFRDSSLSATASSWRSSFLAVILLVQVGAGLFAVAVSLHHPFSYSQQAAAVLQHDHLESNTIVFEPNNRGAAVLAYLQMPASYDLALHRSVSFTPWTREQSLGDHIPTPAEMAAVPHAESSPVLITGTPLTASQTASLHLQLIASFSGAICTGEDLYLYH